MAKLSLCIIIMTKSHIVQISSFLNSPFKQGKWVFLYLSGKSTQYQPNRGIGRLQTCCGHSAEEILTDNNIEVHIPNAEKWITKIVSIHLWFLLGSSYKMKHIRGNLCNKFFIWCEIQQSRLTEMEMKMMMMMMMTIIDKIMSYTRFTAVWH